MNIVDELQVHHYRLYLIKIQSSNKNVLNAWNLFVNTSMQVASGFEMELLKYSTDKYLLKCTIAIISHGNNNVLVKACGPYRNGKLRSFMVKEGLLQAVWEMFQLFLRDVKPKNGGSFTLHCIRQKL